MKEVSRYYQAKFYKAGKHVRFSFRADNKDDAVSHAAHCAHVDGYRFNGAVIYIGREEPANAGAYIPIN